MVAWEGPGPGASITEDRVALDPHELSTAPAEDPVDAKRLLPPGPVAQAQQRVGQSVKAVERRRVGVVGAAQGKVGVLEAILDERAVGDRSGPAVEVTRDDYREPATLEPGQAVDDEPAALSTSSAAQVVEVRVQVQELPVAVDVAKPRPRRGAAELGAPRRWLPLGCLSEPAPADGVPAVEDLGSVMVGVNQSSLADTAVQIPQSASSSQAP